MNLLIRIALVALSVLVGWWVGTDIGLLVGIASDEATANNFVSSALFTIGLFGFIGAGAMLFVALRLTRSR